jgi:hypothetical protein
MRPKKNEKLVSIRIYFTDAKLLDRVANIADGLDVSLSSASGMILRAGIDEVETMVNKLRGVKHEKQKSK